MPVVVLLAALCALVVLTPAASAAERDPTRCKAKQSRTLLKTPYVRVFETPSRRGYEGAKYLYGCLFSAGRRIRLDETWDDAHTNSQSYGLVTVGGRFVAWRHTRTDLSCKANCPDWYDAHRKWIYVYDLRERGRRRVDAEVDGNVLVATTTGGVAWLEPASSPTEPLLGEEFELHASDRNGRRLLDSGRIEPDSVTARGRVVHWVRDGERRSAELG